MAKWDVGLVRVQQEEDGTYLYEIKELKKIARAETLQEAKDEIINNLRGVADSLDNGERLGQIEAEMAALQQQLDGLRSEHERLSAIPPGIVAMELLEELPKFNNVLRLFEIDHPLEQYWGNILTIGFLLRRDLDGDGDVDIETVLYARRKIEVTP